MSNTQPIHEEGWEYVEAWRIGIHNLPDDVRNQTETRTDFHTGNVIIREMDGRVHVIPGFTFNRNYQWATGTEIVG